MTRIAKILAITTFAAAAFAPMLAEAHPHRVCHMNHHHRVCHWVR